MRTYGSLRGEYVAVLLAATFFFSGCGALKHRAPDRKTAVSAADAAAWHAFLCDANRGLNTFKGMGTISMQQGGRKERFRAAWAAEAPDRLRIELLGLAGQPVASMACDGSHYYLLTHHDGKFIKRRTDASGLRKFIHIPINALDVLALLSGRLAPPKERLIASIEKDAPHEPVLVIRDVAEKIQDRVFSDGPRGAVKTVERCKDNGQLVWRAELDHLKNEKNYHVPYRVTLSAGEDVKLQIHMERFWANPDVAANLFVIEAP